MVVADTAVVAELGILGQVDQAADRSAVAVADLVADTVADKVLAEVEAAELVAPRPTRQAQQEHSHQCRKRQHFSIYSFST
jgi:phosphatidylserine/phosphatidylglycerophosphate/cardiolipin synthase-like enzyme